VRKAGPARQQACAIERIALTADEAGLRRGAAEFLFKRLHEQWAGIE
jgi:hypothetical protein